MAELLSAFAQARLNAKGAKTNGYPNAARMQRTVKVARDTYTTTGAEANNDTIKLDIFLPAGSVVNVENCKLRFGASGTFSASVTLQRVRAGVVTSLSAALATTSAAVGTFAAAAITPPTESQAGDILQLLITPFTSATAGKVIALEIQFDAPLI
jgi:hypothetical protein